MNPSYLPRRPSLHFFFHLLQGTIGVDQLAGDPLQITHPMSHSLTLFRAFEDKAS